MNKHIYNSISMAIRYSYSLSFVFTFYLSFLKEITKNFDFKLEMNFIIMIKQVAG